MICTHAWLWMIIPGRCLQFLLDVVFIIRSLSQCSPHLFYVNKSLKAVFLYLMKWMHMHWNSLTTTSEARSMKARNSRLQQNAPSKTSPILLTVLHNSYISRLHHDKHGKYVQYCGQFPEFQNKLKLIFSSVYSHVMHEKHKNHIKYNQGFT